MKFGIVIILILLAALVGGVVGARITYWCDNHNGPVATGKDKSQTDDTKIPGDPMSCVDLYYKAIKNRNHAQYQLLVVNPKSIADFTNSVEQHLKEMKDKGLRFLEVTNVRGRENIVKDKPTKVKAVSPWSQKEVIYEVVQQGQGWRIKKEK